MAIEQLLADLRGDRQFMANVALWRVLPAQTAQNAPLPDWLALPLRDVLVQRGIETLYSHQAAAVAETRAGSNVAVVTPTASGKTLCYNLPVLHSLLVDQGSCALYLFPTKALAQDQLAELQSLASAVDRTARSDEGRAAAPLTISTYDGDTPGARRSGIRQSARILLTNPDMLHAGILPYHTNWARFFGGLRYIVIDEMHVYRGVFGSHVANVLRRLQRICRFYQSRPQFVLASATIANPQELAQRLIEQPVTVIDESGAPRGEKHIILYNPPIYDAEQGLRRSSTLETQELAVRCVRAGLQSIVFGRSRLTTELLLTYLRERLMQATDRGVEPRVDPDRQVRGYRGGYLPAERRSIEAGLRQGQVRAVVATNALELGIDIGRLQAALLCGYPGTIAATWQQMGRAGRTQAAALAILVATGGALDQYVLQHPEFLFARSPEHALINPDNLMLAVDQMRCALFELPLALDEPFGPSDVKGAVMELLVERGEAIVRGPRLFWTGQGYPAHDVSLRSAGRDIVTIQALENGQPRVVGEIDVASAPLLVHDGAVYLHEGQSYLVDQLDRENRLAHISPCTVDFYTEVATETSVDVQTQHDVRAVPGGTVAHGELLVSNQVVGYRRIKRFTHETLGVYPLDYPPSLLDTAGCWFTINAEVQRLLAEAGQWHDSVNDYGPGWQTQRQAVRRRDGYRCSRCGAAEPAGRQHDVHHVIPFRTFGYVAGVNDFDKLANRLENLLLVCRSCHRRLETAVRVRTGLDGLAYALANLAPLHLMCDRADLGVAVMRGDPLSADPSAAGAPTQLPAVYLYERISAGLGFSLRLYELHETLLAAAGALIRGCRCVAGCPACVGPILETDRASLETKQLSLALLDLLCTGIPPAHPPTDDEIRF